LRLAASASDIASYVTTNAAPHIARHAARAPRIGRYAATHVAWYLVRHAATLNALRLAASAPDIASYVTTNAAPHIARHAVSRVVQLRRACFPRNLHVRRLTNELPSLGPTTKRNLHRCSQNFQRRTRACAAARAPLLSLLSL
jgi:hypothetical protein